MVPNYRFAKLAPLAFALLSLCSCIEKCFPGKVSSGIARLTVNNLGNLVLAISHGDFEKRIAPNCRLKEVAPNPDLEASGNGYGKASWDFTECIYDFGNRTVLTFEDDCGSTTVTYSGKVFASGRRSVSGILTGNQENPIIPTKDGLSISFTHLQFENFRVESKDQPSAMTMVSGSLSFDLKVLLGKAKDSICRIPIPNPTFTNIRYTKSGTPNIVRLPGLLFDFDAEVSGSDFGAQVGESNNIVNFLSGRLTLWGEELPVPNDGQSLDPTFQMANFEKSLSCISELSLPLTTNCHPEDDIVKGVANLSAINLGALLAMLTKEEGATKPCNLRNFENATLTKRDKFNGKAEWTFDNCTLDFGRNGQEFVLGADSHFKGRVFGKVTYSGSRALVGRLTGNALFPVIPETGEMRIAFTRAHFENFAVKVEPFPSLTLVDATLSFDVIVHLMKSGKYETYQTPLENPTLQNIRFLQSSDVIVSNPPGLNGDYHFKVNASELEAQFGRFAGKENHFEGTLNMFGTSFEVAQSELIPDYKRAITDSTLKDAPKDSFEKVEAALGDGASRLSVLNLSRLIQVVVGNNLSSIDDRPECNLRVLKRDDAFTTITEDQASADTGKVTWRFISCEYDLSHASNLPAEMASISGRVVLSGERSIEGHLTGNPFQPVIPTSGKYVIRFNRIEFHDFYVAEKKVAYDLTITAGAASLDVTIPLQIDPKTRLYSEHADDLIYEHIRFGEGTQFLISIREAPSNGVHGLGFESEMKGNFIVPVHDSDLFARVAENKIEGTIGIFDSRVVVPTDKMGLDMRPVTKFVPEAHRHDTIENFDALMIARLLTLDVATIAQEAYAEDLKIDNYWPNCGFSSNRVRLQGAAIGDVGQRGQMRFAINNCEIIKQSQPASLPDPCTEHPPLVKGRVVASGTQIVRGLREKYCVPFFGCFDSIMPDNPHATDFDFSSIIVDNFESFLSPQSDGISGGLRMVSGDFQAKVHPVLAEKKEKHCDFSRTTPIARFEIKMETDIPVELELSYKGLPFFKSKPLTINSARLLTQNGVFNAVGNFLSGELVVNGGTFNFNSQVDRLDPYYTQEAFDQSYACRAGLEPGQKYFEDFAIREVLPAQGWTTDCPKPAP